MTNVKRESLEEENIKLLEMVRQREETIKRLESRTRSALEISIKADDGIRHIIDNPPPILSFSNQGKCNQNQITGR